MARDEHPQKPSKGVSLAKGPVGLLGLLGLIYGISALILGGHAFTTQHVPHGAVHGKTWLGVEVNGWSDLVFIAAGLLLMFGAPLHWGAKSMSGLVGLALGALAVIALVGGDGVFGLVAANRLTELVWGAAAVVLLLLSLLPRVGGKRPSQQRDQAQTPPGSRRVQRRAHTATSEPASRHSRWLEGAEEQDRPPSAGAYKTDDHESR